MAQMGLWGLGLQDLGFRVHRGKMRGIIYREELHKKMAATMKGLLPL